MPQEIVKKVDIHFSENVLSEMNLSLQTRLKMLFQPNAVGKG